MTSIALPGAAHGLVWNAGTSTLFLTNATNDHLIKYTDAGGVTDVEALPAAANGETTVDLGDIDQRSDGSFLIASTGLGSDGAIFKVPAGGGSSSRLTTLAVARQRVGIAENTTTIFTSYFTGTTTAPVGAVAALTITGAAGTEVNIATEQGTTKFKQLGGLVATDTAVFVADITAKTIYQIALPLDTVTVLASGLPSAGDLVRLPNGDLLTGGGTTITRVTPAGVKSALLFTGLTDVEGLAYDATGGRLFVVDHGASADTLKIFPLAQ